MQHIWTVFLFLAFAYWARCLLVRWRRQEMIRKSGCQPVVEYPSSEPFGRDYDRITKQSFIDGRVNPVKLEFFRTCRSSTYEIRSFQEQVIFTSDPSNHQCFMTNIDVWEKVVRPATFPFFGTNILDQNGAAWRRTRDLINPLFQRAEVQELKYFKKFVDHLIARIPHDGDTVDLQPLIRKLCLDSSSEFIFGESIDSLTDTTGRADAFLAAFNRAVSGVGKRTRPSGLQLQLNNVFGRLNITWDRAWRTDCRVVHDYIDGCIARYRGRGTPATAKTREEGKRFILIEGMSEAIADPIALRFHLLGIFHIARETAAMGLTNILFLLARNPDIWAQLRSQALALGPSDEEITFDRLNRLPPLFRHTVLEAWRLHNPIARHRRVATRDTVLPRGGGTDGSSPAFMPKGTVVWDDRYPKTRDPELWGPDVEEFRPSRFDGKRLAWEFQPFAGGPRVCPASQKMVSQAIYLLVRLTREFEVIENRDPCNEFLEDILLCFVSRNGCKVALHPGKEDGIAPRP